MKIVPVILLCLCLLVVLAIFAGIRNHNQYALFRVAESGDVRKVRLLVQQGAPVNQKSDSTFGFTPLIAAIYHNNTNVIYYLVDAGADVNLADNNDETPLMWSTTSGDEAVPVVNYLIKHGARLDARDRNGSTVFDYARSAPPKPKLLYDLKLYGESITNKGARDDVVPPAR